MPATGKFYQRRTMQRIPRNYCEAERFLWHAYEHIVEPSRVGVPGELYALQLIHKVIGQLQHLQEYANGEA